MMTSRHFSAISDHWLYWQNSYCLAGLANTLNIILHFTFYVLAWAVPKIFAAPFETWVMTSTPLPPFLTIGYTEKNLLAWQE